MGNIPIEVYLARFSFGRHISFHLDSTKANPILWLDAKSNVEAPPLDQL